MERERTDAAVSAESAEDTRAGIDLHFLARGEYLGWRFHRLHGGGYEAVKPGLVRLWSDDPSSLLNLIESVSEPVAA